MYVELLRCQIIDYHYIDVIWLVYGQINTYQKIAYTVKDMWLQHGQLFRAFSLWIKIGSCSFHSRNKAIFPTK